MGSKPAETTKVQQLKVSTPPWADLEDAVEVGVEDEHDDSPVKGDVQDELRSGK